MGLYSNGSSGSKPTYKPQPLGSGGGGSIDVEQPASGGSGKGSIDMTDAAASIGQTLGSFAEFGSNLAGGAIGALGSLGPDADTASLGQVAEDIGRVPGGVGDLQLPYAGDDPTRQGATLAQGAGMLGDVLSAPGRFVEREVAKGRAGGGVAGDILGGLPGAIPGVGNVQNIRQLVTGEDTRALPPDLQVRLDEGESVDVIADELLARGQGFSSDAGINLASEVLYDPLNLIAPGLGKAAQGIKGAGVAVRSVDDLAHLGLGKRAVGTIYNTATRGLDQAGGALVDRFIGPVTSGVFHTLGTKPYQALISGASKLDRAYGVAFERAFALGAGQLPRAIIAREVMQDVGSKLARKAGDVERTVDNRLFAKSTAAKSELERRTEELLARVTPAFSVIDESVTNATVRKYAATTGMSVEDATAVLGKIDKNTARTVHLAYYGHAGGELAELKKVIPASKKLDVDRLTVIAPDTLTDELADAIVAGDIPPVDAVENFSVLSNHFGGKAPSDADVLAFIDKIRDTLPEAVKLPKTGKNALPKELGDWRARNEEFGYELGFAPKDGWKSIVDEHGDAIMSDPFVHFTSDVDPVTMRNPLGRFMDSLMRGTTQTVIVQQSRERMVDFMARKGIPISPNETRAIHKQILEEAADRGLTPRALAGERLKGRPLYDDIFKRNLSNEAYDALISKYDPTYVVMHAFEGNWKTIGLTQKFTGRVKSAPQGGAMIAKMTEALYPKARFTFRPTFQAQEVIESPVFNALRGVTDRPVADDLVDAYRALAEQPEFRYLTEANFLNIAGIRRTEEFMGANTKIGRATGRFTNIQGRKETARIRQVMFEHGDDFKEAVLKINPKFWKAMEEAYDSTDPRIIADRFLGERLALGADENIDTAMKLVDEAVGPSGTPFWELPEAEQAAIATRLRDEGYVFHGSAVDPRTSGSAVDAAGFFTSSEFDYSRLYARGTIKNSPEAAAKGEVYATKLPSPDRIGDMGDPAVQAKVKGVVAADVAALRDKHEFMSAVERAAKRVEGASGNAMDVGGERTLVSALSDYALERAKLLDPNAGIDNAYAGQVLREVGFDAYKFPAENMGSVGGEAGRLAPTYVFTKKPELRAIDEVMRPNAIQRAYDAGDTAAGQALNVAEGMARGGSAASGGAVKVEGALPTTASEMVLQAFKDSFRQSSLRAFQTHFFNSQRGWLERSLNHPYLGLYPLSYMWGKVLPEFARFLVKRPFGVNAPGLGLANLERVQQAYLGALADDPEFAQYIEDNEDAIYFANLLFPGNPVNMAVNAPAWARHVGDDAAAGKLKDPGKTISREIVDSGSYAFGPIHDLTSISKTGADLADMGQDIFESLTKAAAQYDGQYPTGAPPAPVVGTPLTP